tara:strand:- start:273 stop:458 length:186 start_codon:yes stop_codon:yes gene_type:complete
MTSSTITAKSSKADIIQASEEYIGVLDEKLSLEKRLVTTFKEQRNFLISLLAATTLWEMLF